MSRTSEDTNELQLHGRSFNRDVSNAMRVDEIRQSVQALHAARLPHFHASHLVFSIPAVTVVHGPKRQHAVPADRQETLDPAASISGHVLAAQHGDDVSERVIIPSDVNDDDIAASPPDPQGVVHVADAAHQGRPATAMESVGADRVAERTDRFPFPSHVVRVPTARST